MSNYTWALKLDAGGGYVFGDSPEDCLDKLDCEPAGQPFRLPTIKAVCWRCGGEGKHNHPAFDDGITSAEWGQWDADERDDYRSGLYDVPCTRCHGLRVVDEIDEDALGVHPGQSSYLGWFSAPNRGEPFDSALSRAVWARLDEVQP